MSREAENLDDEDDEDDDREDDEDTSIPRNSGAIAPIKDEPLAQREPTQRLVKINNKIEVIEDLFSAFPAFGDGSGRFKVRISRNKPKVFIGHNIFGNIGDIDVRFTIDDMRDMYGGGEFTVAMIGPIAGPRNAEGEPPTKQLRHVIVNIPGPPRMHFKDQDMNRPPMPPPGYMTPPPGQAQPMMMQNAVAPQVQLKQLDIEERRENKHEQSQMIAWQQSSEASRNALSEVKAFAAEQVADLRRQLDVQVLASMKKDEELRLLGQKIAIEQSNAVTQTRIAEDATRTRLEIEKDLNRLKDDFRRNEESAERRHTSAQEELRNKLEVDRNRIERDSINERDRIREEARSREQSMRDEFERRMSSQKETFENRIADLRINTDRELASIRESRDQTIRNVEQMTSNKVDGIKSAAEIRVGLLDGEVTRLRDDASRLQKRYDDLQKATAPKDTMTVIRESTELAQMVGFVPASEAKGETEEGEFDWKKMAAKGVMGLIEKAPEVAAQIGQMRNQGAMQRQQAQAVAVAQQQQRQRPRMLPPPQQLQQQQASGSSQQAMGQLQQPIPGIVGPVRSAASLRPYYQPAPLQEQPQVTPSQPPPPPAPVVTPSQPPPSMATFQPQAQVATQNQQATEQIEGLTAENITRFIDALESTIKDGVVSPALFAKQFVEHIGQPETIRALIERITPEMLIQQVEASNADMHIVTRDGQRFVHQVWAEVKKIIGA